jgi:hypothetical protein
MFFIFIMTSSVDLGSNNWKNNGVFPWVDPNAWSLSQDEITQLLEARRSFPLLEDARLSFRQLLTPQSASRYQTLSFVGRVESEMIRGFRQSRFVIHFEGVDDIPVTVLTRTFNETNNAIARVRRMGTILGALPQELVDRIDEVHLIFNFGESTVENGTLTLYVFSVDLFETLGALEEFILALLLDDFYREDTTFTDFQWVQAVVTDNSYLSRRSLMGDINDRVETTLAYLALRQERIASLSVQIDVTQHIAARMQLIDQLPWTFPPAATSKATTTLTTTPYRSTIYEFGALYSLEDPTLYLYTVYTGRQTRNVYDRRIDAFVNLEGYLFNAHYRGGKVIEVFVNDEFDSLPVATRVAEFYPRTLGLLPYLFIDNIDRMWIHLGQAELGGTNNTLLIHTDRAGDYAKLQILEEVMLHEAAHSALDWAYGGLVDEDAWRSAQAKDPGFISEYAKEFPLREDVADSIIAYFAARVKPERFDAAIVELIERQIPNRLDVLSQFAYNQVPTS